MPDVEGFEEYPVGSEPYPSLGAPAVVTDERAYTGVHSLTSAPSGELTQALVIITDECTYPMTARGFAWLVAPADLPPESGGTPDLLIVTDEFLVSVGYDDFSGPEQGYPFTVDNEGTFHHGPDPITATGWYEFTLTYTGGPTFAATVTGPAFSWSTTTSIGTLAPGLWESIFGSPPVPNALAVAVDIPRYTFWDDIDLCGEGDVTRLWPRDDGRGLSPGPRIHPPTRAQRIVGGYQ